MDLYGIKIIDDGKEGLETNKNENKSDLELQIIMLQLYQMNLHHKYTSKYYK